MLNQSKALEDEQEMTINEEQIRSINKRNHKTSIVIYPDSVFRNMIDGISFVLIFFISLYIPFVFTFNIDTGVGATKYMEFFIDIWFI